jgi:protein CpxP
MLLTALCAALVLGSGLTAGAAGWNKDGDAGRFERGPRAQRMHRPQDSYWQRMADVLDLTEAQQKKVVGLLADHHKVAEKMRRQMMKVHRQMRQAMNPKTFDEKKIRSLASRQAGMHADLMVGRARMRSQIHGLLTAEQQELLDLDCKLRRLHSRGPARRRMPARGMMPPWFGDDDGGPPQPEDVE